MNLENEGVFLSDLLRGYPMDDNISTLHYRPIYLFNDVANI
jgi:hypothetical protein